MPKAPQPPKGDETPITDVAPVEVVAPKAPVRKPAKRIDYNEAPAPDATPVEPPPAKPIRTVRMETGAVRHDY